MKLKNLLTKTLLAAGMLCVGGNAWAVDYTIAWQNLFDDAGTYQDGWSGAKSRSSATNTVAQGTRSGDAKYISFSNNAYNTVWTYTLSGISAISSATDYTFDMDFALTRCNTSGTTLLTLTNAADGELFKVSATGGDTGKGSTTLVTGNVYINGSSTAESETVTMNTFRGGTLTWYTIHITSNATTGTDLTLTKCDDATETHTYHLSDAVVALGKIILNPSNANQTYYGGGCFDNFILKTPEDETSVSEPTYTITDFDGTSRTIELSTLTDGATIYYSETSSDPEETSAWSTYSSAFATTATPIYAYAKKGEYSSTVATIETGAGTAFTLNTPSWQRTGANTYKISATATSALGVTATQTIHYTVNGGAEQTSSSPATIENVDGDIVAWTTASKFEKSANLNISYVAAIPLSNKAWTYNLNSYPSSHSCTSIAAALNTGSGTEINGSTLYNLKEENYPNLFIENAEGWLLRDRSSNAWKCQSARTSIAFNNVTTSNVIYVNASNDNSATNSINSVINGTVKYNYYMNDFFIVPNADGAVTVTFNTGSSINEVAVYNTTVPISVTAVGYATLCPTYNLDFSATSAIEACKASVAADGKITYTKVNTVKAGEGVLLRSVSGAAADENIPVIASATLNEGNAFVGITTEQKLAQTADGCTNYILASGASGVGFYKVNTNGSWVKAGTAYLKVAPSAAREFFSLDDETTGINAISNEQSTMNSVFDLQGRRVAQPQKGLYIVNGKKVVIK